MKTWIARVRDIYCSLEDLQCFDSIYNTVERCGYKSAENLWKKNPFVGGSVHPRDFGRVSASEMKCFQKRGRVRKRLKGK